MTTTEARKILLEFIEDERYWRNKVFACNSGRRAEKLSECDQAIEALNVLAPEPESAAQPGLFEDQEGQL